MEIIGGIGETKSIMLKVLVLAAVLCFFSLLSAVRAWAQDAAVFVQSRTAQSVSLSDMTDDLAAYDVVIFGEFHDSQPIHDAELAVLEGLYQKHGVNLVLSMEMFERVV